MRAVALLVVAAGLAAGCGDAPPGRQPPAVRITIDAPADAGTVQDESVDVSGTVRPRGADVRVAGQEAQVHDGSWSIDVPLEPGSNVLDVTATAPGRSPGVTALRVVRQMPIPIPAGLDELPPDEARSRLEGLGFRVREERRGGLLDRLLPGQLGVCGTDPKAGDALLAGETVTLEVAKVC